ncbi:MAG: glycoside hydrolase family 97 protein [Bacteroidales bacterium]|nr:glycoside hydrolase family 97 protein [Bacteroidales bacterium]
MKQLLHFLLITIFIPNILFGKEYKIASPDSKTEVIINTGKQLTYSVKYNGVELLRPSAISMTIDDDYVLGRDVQVRKLSTRTVDEEVIPVVREKRAIIENHFNEINLQFKGDYGIIFRVYNQGLAYRFTTNFKKEITVYSEEATFNFAKNDSVYFPDVQSYFTSFQRYYEYIALDQIGEDKMCITPALVDVANGPNVLIAEADLDDYPGMFLKGNNNTSLSGDFAPVVLEDEAVTDKIIKRADYIAQTSGSREFPWRVVGIAQNDADIINNQMIFLLGKPCQIENTNWIKPGKVAWDWWNANNIYGVDFRAGLNTDTYKYYIDFASEYGIEYIILDEGWSDTYDLTKLNPEVDLEELSKYAKTKNVGLVLWVEWRTFNDHMDYAVDLFNMLDVKGIKVDFMRRDDQFMVNFYHRVAQKCADNHLLVNFHGSYEPTGLRRQFPNVISREGVNGLEQCKWSDRATPEYNVTLPFIRMFAGPMDYTPGAMTNAQKKNFKDIFDRPMGLGTRCHQLAMYVVFESPMQMLADSPSNYYKEPECMEFLSAVPSVWDETVVLNAKIGDYIALARKSGKDWFVGAMTDWDSREMILDFSFLEEGNYQIEIYQDGINVDRCGNDYKKLLKEIDNTQTLKIELKSGGGWVARMVRL